VVYLSAALQSLGHAEETRLAFANAKFQLKDYASALGVLEAVPPPASDPSYSLLCAAILDKLQRYPEALAAYQQAIKSRPDDERSYLELGLFFVNHQAYDASLENYQSAEKRLPDSMRLAVAEAIAQNLAGHREQSYRNCVRSKFAGLSRTSLTSWPASLLIPLIVLRTRSANSKKLRRSGPPIP
jgi:tetratricopeptide (TPR) repeat protein